MYQELSAVYGRQSGGGKANHYISLGLDFCIAKEETLIVLCSLSQECYKDFGQSKQGQWFIAFQNIVPII
jgi:hypothetical protein